MSLSYEQIHDMLIDSLQRSIGLILEHPEDYKPLKACKIKYLHPEGQNHKWTKIPYDMKEEYYWKDFLIYFKRAYADHLPKDIRIQDVATALKNVLSIKYGSSIKPSGKRTISEWMKR